VSLPTGTVTFLLTDIEGSTQLWQWHDDVMARVIERHDELIAKAVADHGGGFVKSKGEGDSTFSVFAKPTDAVAAAVDAQRAVRNEAWPNAIELKVRAGLHTGEAELRDGDYYGSAVNRCARLRSIAHGGQTICSHPTADLVTDALPRGITIDDLGDHQLRDLARSEHVFQICADDLDHEFPPLLSLDAFKTNLPTQRTSFVGREAELAAVRKRLAGDRLVTLTGVGGCGKTRLALQVAADELDGFSGGVWFADLASVTDPTAVVGAVARAVGLLTEGGISVGATSPTGERLLDYLSARVALLVLDNCEHLIAACASFVDEALGACPRLTILATSREALEVEGERTYSIPSMTVPDEGDPTQSESVVLFAERAEAVRADFAVTHDNADDIAEICRRLDGIPLAIELAAAQVSHLSPHQIASRLDDRFGLLTGGRLRVQRQQTLAAALDWSFELLDETERVLLRRLAVFPGDFTLEAGEAVSGDDFGRRTVGVLRSLVAKSMVMTGESGADLRYRLLETVRLYAEEKLVEAGEAEDLRRRHRDHFLEWAEGLELTGDDWWFRILSEQHNFRAALVWSEREGRLDLVARISSAMFPVWSAGLLDEGVRWLTLGIEAVDRLARDERVRLYAARAMIAMTAIDAPASKAAAARAIEEFGDQDGPDLWASLAYGVMSLTISFDGLLQNPTPVAESYRLGTKVLERAGAPIAENVRELGRRAVDLAPIPAARSNALAFLGMALVTIGDFEGAVGALEESRSITVANEVDAELAYLYHVLGRHEAALAIAPLESDRPADWPLWELSARCLALAGLGRHDEALGEMRRLIAKRGAFRIPGVLVIVVIVLSVMASLRGEHDRAYVLASAATISMLRGVLRSPTDLAVALHHGPHIRSALDDEAAERLGNEGYAMTLEDAVAYGLEQTSV
jgi:predicted ATPase/class 3 adenylate cyclase